MRFAFDFVYESLNKAAERQKHYYDVGLKPREFGVGDWVWRWYLPAIQNKLGQGWTGPYLITRRCSEVNYEIQKGESEPNLNQKL